jgi:hypothetical protein
MVLKASRTGDDQTGDSLAQEVESLLQQQLEHRLQALKSELATGHTALADLQTRETSVRETLLRISGAIQVLEEELARANSHGVALDARALVSE